MHPYMWLPAIVWYVEFILKYEYKGIAKAYSKNINFITSYGYGYFTVKKSADLLVGLLFI